MRPLRTLFFRSPLLFFGTLLSFLAGCGWLNQRPSLQAREGDPVEIMLPANFSTGYRWVLEPALQAGRKLSENYRTDPSAPMVPGAPGTQIFRIGFPREGKFNLKFAYRRLWEPSSVPPAQTTNLVILVTPRKSPPSSHLALYGHSQALSSLPRPFVERHKERLRLPRPSLLPRLRP
ncbi:MAG: hypothetical protein EBV83_03520 [Verrucomicrobia bacterium]|nr:hypothetical protein [Verrucomicrobiota bacterium]